MIVTTCFENWQTWETQDGAIHWRGALYDDAGSRLDPASLIPLGLSDIRDVVESHYGFFAFIMEKKGSIIACVDPIRSIPIFYIDDVVISDSAEHVRTCRPAAAMDAEARAEFLLAGYVTGNRALWSDIKQLCAGEIAVFSGGGVNRQRYIEFDHRSVAALSHEEFRSRLDRVLDHMFRRLIAHAGGRQIVVPLSGGYDSRLVVTMLKKLGYTNVLCFSYGVDGNEESAVSKSVAEVLGFPWIFVPYRNEDWRRSWRSDSAASYRSFASGSCSLPHMQDWLAVEKLGAERKIESDCIFVPGHAGDFIEGGYITENFLHPLNLSKNRIIDFIIASHFSAAPSRARAEMARLRRRLSDALGDGPFCSEADAANAYERWVWEERQAKYTANSLRVYDHFKIDWWMPLWDQQFIHYWNAVPLELRIERRFAVGYIEALYRTVAGSADPAPRVDLQRRRPGLRYTLKLAVPRWKSQAISRLLQKRRLRATYKRIENHPLGFASLVPRERLRPLVREGYNVIGIYSKLYLEGSWGDLR
ncbi:asparagine synthase C-terminal domain-containing protein [Ancylobacter sp. FA202]|uniref:asparagine synthase C-terminal domain-containing protein n=1 Tax=Ancylobacter sp. FA202 TaxID=1111106 RepID=UPI00036A6B51|nr:asparagine synthase C-terminal domain-containing protein [Ancylobacter sp. FA202]